MNEQSMPPNSAGSEMVGSRPEQLPMGHKAEAPAASEMAPAPGNAAAPASAMQSQGQPPARISRGDVAAVIAAVPGPNGPSGAVPTPTMAGDVDVIEPEWVDKAEEVVKTTQGDPYGEEEAVEHLQEDYLQKRYGYNVADPNGDANKPEKA